MSVHRSESSTKACVRFHQPLWQRFTAADPLWNMKLIAPGHADSYEEQPFPPSYTAGIAPFSNIRFMDRGQTNATEDRIANFDGIVTAIETEDVEAFFGRLLD